MTIHLSIKDRKQLYVSGENSHKKMLAGLLFIQMWWLRTTQVSEGRNKEEEEEK